MRVSEAMTGVYNVNVAPVSAIPSIAHTSSDTMELEFLINIARNFEVFLTQYVVLADSATMS